LVCCLIFPLVSKISWWLGLFLELDLFFVACTISIAGLFLYIKRYHQAEWYTLDSEAILEKLDEAVMVVNTDREVVHVNPAFFGFFIDFPQGNHAFLLSHFIDYLKNRLARVFPPTLFEDLASFVPDHSEGEFTMVSEYNPEADIGRERQTYTLTRQNIRVKDQLLGQAIVLSDVSSYRDMIEEVGLLKQRAEEASKSKSEFLATMSHEIRTPLNAIIGIAEIQLQKNQNEDTHADLERIYHSGASLLGIINDILDISKIETGNFELVPVDYQVSSLINDTVQLNIVRIGSKPIVFELEIDETIPVKLFGDEVRVRQILNNLLSNAIKYTQEGKVTLKITWAEDAKASPATGVLTIRVRDTGQGIKEEDMDKLFAQYGQLNARANRNIEGTGLGLSITKTLVEMMGGAIWVKSKYGQGTVFTVTILQQILDPAPLGKETVQNLEHFRFIEDESSPERSRISIQVSGGKVLVVDDVETNLYVARGLLLPYGLAVDCVKSGQEALDRIQAAGGAYDIIFMDHMMPGLDGIETTRLIRDWEAGNKLLPMGIPVIALTANAIVGMREMFLEKGFNDYLSKPISRAKLDEILVRWVPPEKQQPLSEEPPSSAPDTLKQENLVIQGLDINTGVMMVGGSWNSYLEVLDIFSQDAAQRLVHLGAIPGETELPFFTTQVHSLKGASASVGATGISRQAARLEDAARRGDRDTIKEQLGSFYTDLEALVQNIRIVLHLDDAPTDEAAAEGPVEVSPVVRAALEQLRAALEDEEIRPIDNQLKNVKALTLDPPLRRAVSSIADYILVSEFNQAIVVIDGLLRSH
jgi:signal transduction histidine kinase/FixJ family two-component response regulator/HPt (histidine-containing phosphotransfer) domain-containing protein